MFHGTSRVGLYMKAPQSCPLPWGPLPPAQGLSTVHPAGTSHRQGDEVCPPPRWSACHGRGGANSWGSTCIQGSVLQETLRSAETLQQWVPKRRCPWDTGTPPAEASVLRVSTLEDPEMPWSPKCIPHVWVTFLESCPVTHKGAPKSSCATALLL